MNETAPKIEVFSPFGEAFELTKKILFQPFDLLKWLAIGLAAFLAYLGDGCNFNWPNTPHRTGIHNFGVKMQQIPVWILVSGVILIVVMILAIAVLCAWLRARGRFMLIDCVVKNRGAVKEPWREFRELGNSFFFFALVVGCAWFVLAMLGSLPFMLPILRGVAFLHLHDFYLISMVSLWVLIMFAIAFAWALITHIMVVVMYRHHCRALAALPLACSLISKYPGEITLYCLFWIVLALGVIFLACIFTCATCCLTMIPYVGTVILLPLFVCQRAFGLFFLRQFGSDYDAWATVSPLGGAMPPPIPPTEPLSA